MRWKVSTQFNSINIKENGLVDFSTDWTTLS